MFGVGAAVGCVRMDMGEWSRHARHGSALLSVKSADQWSSCSIGNRHYCSQEMGEICSSTSGQPRAAR